MQRQNVTPGSFPDRLQSCLDEQGWTKTELSRRLEVTHPAVLKWWKGQVPKADTLFKMAALFKVSPSWLADGTPPRHPIETGWLTKEQLQEASSAAGVGEPPPIYGTDWRGRALDAEQKLRTLQKSILDLYLKTQTDSKQ